MKRNTGHPGQIVSHLLLTVALSLISAISQWLGAAEPETPYYVYDIRSLQSFDRTDIDQTRRVWDETLLITTLQGLVNRDSAQLYLLYVSGFGHQTDEFWLELFSRSFKDSSGDERPGWLEGRERKTITSLDEALDLFASYYQGVVVYDEEAASTVNVALTIAGVENLLPIRYDSHSGSLYDRLVSSPDGRRLVVKRRLVNEDGSSMFTGEGTIPGTTLPSTGSVKVDPYYWMIENYIKTGLVNPLEGGYYIDAYWIKRPIGATQNACLTNRDFVVSRKGFFFDLSPWDDEAPNDDPGQKLGADFEAFTAIARSVYDATEGKKMIRIAGFTPWDTKYTDHQNCGLKHGGVDTEWRHAEILSNYNAYMDADALGCGAMANASFYQHFPLADHYPQHKATVEELRVRGLLTEEGRPINKTFVTIYSGDYDSAAWVYQSMPLFWEDSARGSIPINWAFNPNLADRFAPGFDYMRRTQTDLDRFVSGDVGAGYVNPMALAGARNVSGLPDNLDVWVEHCKRYFARWDLSAIGFIIDGCSQTSDRATLARLADCAPDGMTTHRGGKMGVVQNSAGEMTPYRNMNYDLPANLEQASAIILGDTRDQGEPIFNVYRTILWSPSLLKEVMERVKADEARGARVEFVDMYTFWLLLKLEMAYIGEEEVDVRL
ncbi:MAG: GxGYxYP family putative glycoside hydrolase [Planctomycetia bacterium]|nr:GxGYxYP family putative glycoside hydrolase [Planctomycetia bacterium]